MRYLFTVLVLVLSVNAHAQAPAANWCDAGNVWGDGRCDYDDPVLTQYAWDTGWYMGQLEEGFIHYEDIPEQYRAVETQQADGEITLVIPTPYTDEWYEDGYTCFYNWSNYGIKTCYLTCVPGYQWPEICYTDMTP